MIEYRKALCDSYTKEQLATWIFEEIHMDLLPDIKQEKWDKLKDNVVLGYQTLTKIQLITMLYELGFEVEPEPDKEERYDWERLY